MADPTKKSQEVEALISSVANAAGLGDRISSIKGDICVSCGEPAQMFKNELSKKEYRISGFCQVCQDSVFGEE